MALAFVMMIPADLSKMLNLVGFINWIFDGLIMVVHIVLHFRMKDAELLRFTNMIHSCIN
jgi:hypothetical protein